MCLVLLMMCGFIKRNVNRISFLQYKIVTTVTTCQLIQLQLPPNNRSCIWFTYNQNIHNILPVVNFVVIRKLLHENTRLHSPHSLALHEEHVKCNWDLIVQQSI